MKIYISADIEGVGCVAHSEQSSVGGREYEVARRLMTAEVNAAVRGAFDAGATAVTVADSHNVGLNLLVEEIDERAELIIGNPRPLSMMEGIAEGYDAAGFVGYHAAAGTPDSSIVHIFHGRVAEVALNGIRVGEIGFNALLAGHYGVPVVLMTGDAAACAEARDLLGDLETVTVKEGIGSYAARCLHPAVCQRRIYDGAVRAFSRIADLAPFRLEGPVTLTMRLTTASGADRAMRLPGTVRTDPTAVRWEGPDILEAFRAFNAMADLVELTRFL